MAMTCFLIQKTVFLQPDCDLYFMHSSEKYFTYAKPGLAGLSALSRFVRSMGPYLNSALLSFLHLAS